MTIVCVTGMHRSGTSMVTRLLNLCGVYLGDERDLLPPNPDNSEGYWENSHFMLLNDEILSVLGGGWDYPPVVYTGWEQSKRFSGTQDKALKTIEPFSDHEHWGWKDPRNCLTFPFWKALIPSMKVVICLRNPDEVVTSLIKRNYFSPINAYNLWFKYNQRILSYVEPKNRIITLYDSYFQDPRTELKRLLKFLNIHVLEEQLTEAIDEVSAPLRHNRSSLQDLMVKSPTRVIHLYQEMCEEAEKPLQLPTNSNADIQTTSDKASSNNDTEEKILELLSEELTEKRADILAKERFIRTLTSQVARKEHDIKMLTKQVAENERNAQAFVDIQHSRVWKVVLFLRQTRMLLVPSNSYRAQMFKQLTKLVFFPRKNLKKDQEIKENLTLIRESKLFDENWYLANNPDLKPEDVDDPILHFLTHGGSEGRDPGPNFSVNWYLHQYEDVKNLRIHPLIHYVNYGKSEGRKPKPDPIIVHEMGKVGAENMQEALQKAYKALNISVPVYHTFILNGFGALRHNILQEEILRNPTSRLTALEYNENVRKLIDQNPAQHWNIISFVRDPIARNIGMFFQYLTEYMPDWHKRYVNDRLDLQELQSLFLRLYSNHNNIDYWFETQLKSISALNIDVYETPFPHEIGYKIYPGVSQASLLLICFENLSTCVEQAIHEFLGLENFNLGDLHPEAQIDGKDYTDLYHAFEKLPLPIEYVEKVYATQYARHFYTDIELSLFIKHWTKEKNIQHDSIDVKQQSFDKLPAKGINNDGDNALVQNQVQSVNRENIDLVQKQTQGTKAKNELKSELWEIELLLRQIHVSLSPPNRHIPILPRLLTSILDILERIRKEREFREDLALIKSSGFFDKAWYLTNNPDLAQAKMDLLVHYLRMGGIEGRDPGPNFSSSWYLNTYEYVNEMKVNPLVHYLRYGKEEGCYPNLEGSDLALIRSSRLFDEVWYVANNPDIAQTNMDPLLHFLRYGGFNGRDPSADFSSNLYLTAYQDVRSSGINPLVHFLKHGMLEGRLMRPRQTEHISLDLDLKDEDIAKTNDYNAKVKLQIFLKSAMFLEFPTFPNPLVSIILLFHDRAEVSLQCLETLAIGAGDIPFEVVIVDNGSLDSTTILLDRIRNAKIIRNSLNNGFGGGCNQAVDLAVGKYLLFLNNDTQLMPNSLKFMLDVFENEENVGAVGGKLIFPDGRMQEAGSMIWRDGSCQGYGRHDDPFKPEFLYKKDVDYCSGALLLTPKDLFISLGKFDPIYAPAYYEDVDYCIHLWEQGYRVVFQPFAIAIHYEFGSSKAEDAIALQKKNQEKFVEKWGHLLESYDFPDPNKVVFSREHKTDAKRILFIDDRIPDYHLGSGYPRTNRMLHLLADMGYKITFFPLQTPFSVPDIARSLQLKGIEVLSDDSGQKIDFETFIKSRPDYYHIAFVSRPHNMEEVINLIKEYAAETAVVYDAEALFSLREMRLRELNNERVTESEKEALIQAEVNIIKDANVVTTVSKVEKGFFIKYGASSVEILGHIIKPNPTPAAFEERRDILFVGGILGYPSPNEDAVRYFVQNIFPLIREKIECQFYIVGTNHVKAIWDMESDDIHITGRVDDLKPYYNRSRVFVVPTRYSAGIPLKLLEAAAHGLPAVVTPLTATQLGWQENHDLLTGDTPEHFATKVIDLYSTPDLFYSLRQNALERIRTEYSVENFKKDLDHVLTTAMDKRKEQNVVLASKQG